MPMGETKLITQDTARVKPNTKYSLPKNDYSLGNIFEGDTKV